MLRSESCIRREDERASLVLERQGVERAQKSKERLIRGRRSRRDVPGEELDLLLLEGDYLSVLDRPNDKVFVALHDKHFIVRQGQPAVRRPDELVEYSSEQLRHCSVFVVKLDRWRLHEDLSRWCRLYQTAAGGASASDQRAFDMIFQPAFSRSNGAAPVPSCANA
ncbi:MAG: hypothetical protein HY898_05555 [Deltaproteobacteria bacterium]|nr:hypothetical protein [Deltaproteobacteria bacterium]